MDYLLVGFVTCLWLLTLTLAWGLGWVRGYDTAEENSKWSRWLLRQYENRSIRF